MLYAKEMAIVLKIQKDTHGKLVGRYYFQFIRFNNDCQPYNTDSFDRKK